MRANCRLSILAGGMLCYQYRTLGMSYRFHTLREVGAPFQQDFERLLSSLNRKIEFSRYLDKSPWVADFALKART
jgi:hypothetical protein